MRIIISDVLYDCKAADMFYSLIREIGGEPIRHCYYKSTSGNFFRVSIRKGYKDELTPLTVMEMKKVLAEEPEIYRMVIPDPYTE